LEEYLKEMILMKNTLMQMPKLKKKADGLSINVIIVAAIALIVLVVLIAIFTGRMTIFGIGVDQTLKGQKCPSQMWRTQCLDDERGYIGILEDQSSNPGKTCCIPK
jgi:hypothetical protein